MTGHGLRQNDALHATKHDPAFFTYLGPPIIGGPIYRRGITALAGMMIDHDRQN